MPLPFNVYEGNTYVVWPRKKAKSLMGMESTKKNEEKVEDISNSEAQNSPRVSTFETDNSGVVSAVRVCSENGCVLNASSLYFFAVVFCTIFPKRSLQFRVVQTCTWRFGWFSIFFVYFLEFLGLPIHSLACRFFPAPLHCFSSYEAELRMNSTLFLQM